MIGGRLAKVTRSSIIILGRPQTRTLYTDSIYPYPFKYFEKKYPTNFQYRENYDYKDWERFEDKLSNWTMKAFWTFFFYHCFRYPEAFTGHSNLPDPAIFTDEELGIPPDDAGSYYNQYTNYD